MWRDLRRIITFSSLAYPHLNLEEVIKRVVKFDLSTVEVRVSSDGIHLRPSDDPGRVAKLLRDYNVSIVLLSSYVRTRDPDTSEGSAEISLFNKISDLAYRLDTSRIRILASYVDNIDKSIDIARRFLDKISRIALDKGLRILFETHDYFAEISNLRYLIELVSEYDFTGILYDPANMLMRDQDFNQSLELVKNYTYHIHIKDFKKINGEVIYTRPGEGLLPICQVVKKMINLDREIYFSVEWEKLWRQDLEDPDIIIPLYIDYLRRCL